MTPRPSTSTYAVLGLLHLKPWTGYELTQQAQRSLRYAWPKSERLLYSEPKKLVELGYATVVREDSAHRTRNVYTITDEGRRALAEWTSTRTQPPRFEVEALLRLLFADHGAREDVLRTLDELEDDIDDHHQAIVDLMGTYLDGGHPFPQRTHLSVLFATFQIEMFKTIERWIEFARAEIGEWPDTQDLGMTPRTETLTRLLAHDRSPVDAWSGAESQEQRASVSPQGSLRHGPIHAEEAAGSGEESLVDVDAQAKAQPGSDGSAE